MLQRQHRFCRSHHGASLLLAAIGLGVASCGGGSGGGDGSTVPGTGGDPGEGGQFIDSPVTGLSFVGLHSNGVTGTNGEFRYDLGTEVEFSVGGIVLGSLIPGLYSSPLGFVEGAEAITDSDEVLNIARFLQTLDADGNPGSGIEIEPAAQALAVGLSIDFAQSTEEFGEDPEVLAVVETLVGVPLVSAEDAAEHFNATLAAARAGSYGGVFEGDHAGSWRMTTSNDGEVMMIAARDAGGDFVLFGDIAGDGSFLMLGTEAIFRGRIVNGIVAGTWSGVIDYQGTEGSFSGGIEEYGLAFMDAELLAGFAELEGVSILGTYSEDGGAGGGGDASGNFVLSMQEDSHGRVAVRLLVDSYFPSAMYPTAISSTHISFSGVNALGVTFMGTLSTSGEISGTYVPIDVMELGGSFSGSL